MRLSGARFIAGGFVLNVPIAPNPGSRVRAFSRILNRPHLDLVLVTLCVGNQATGLNSFAPVELWHNGAPIFLETISTSAYAYDNFLPWLRMPAQGTLEGFITNGDLVNPATLQMSVEGFYRPSGAPL